MMLAPTNRAAPGPPKAPPAATPLRNYVRHTRPGARFPEEQPGRGAFVRQPATPNIIGFDARRVSPASKRSNRGGVEGFFPPLKKRGSVKSARSTMSTESFPVGPYYQGNLELVPNHELTNRYYHGHRSAPLTNAKVLFRSYMCPRAPESEVKYTNVVTDGYREFIGGDLSYLPKARGFVARRSVPYIDRQKIRRSTSLLSQVIANEHSATFNPDLRQPIAIIRAGVQ